MKAGCIVARHRTYPLQMRKRLGGASFVGAMIVLALVFTLSASEAAQPAKRISQPPASLRDTGLYIDFERLEIDPAHLPFAPQYALWTDGAAKRRWISLPPGTAIDASDPDAWVFPVGTPVLEGVLLRGPARGDPLHRAAGRRNLALCRLRVERRRPRRRPRSGTRARRRLHVRGRPVARHPRCDRLQGVPRIGPHAGARLQRAAAVARSRLRRAPCRAGSRHVDLATLVEAGLLVGLPAALLEAPPRIDAATPAERAAIGYLHGNCGHCHNAEGPLENLGLYLRHVSGAADEPAVASAVGRQIVKPAPGQTPDAVLRIEPGHPERSGLVQRMGSRYGGAADAAARHRTRGRATRSTWSGDGSPRWMRFTLRTKGRNEDNDTGRHDGTAARGGDAAASARRCAGAGRPWRRQVPGRHLRVPRLPHPVDRRSERPGAGHDPGALRPPAGLRDRGAGRRCPSPGSAA